MEADNSIVKVEADISIVKVEVDNSIVDADAFSEGQLLYGACSNRNDEDISDAYTRYSLYIAEHGCELSKLAYDHMISVNSALLLDDQIEYDGNARLCSTIANDVLYPHFKQELINDIGASFYSLILDELPRRNSKYLPVRIVYFSSAKEKLISTFLSLIWLKEPDANGIVDSLCKLIEEYRLMAHKLRGIGGDNTVECSDMYRIIFQQLKQRFFPLVEIRFSSSSLFSAVSRASIHLPKAVDQLIEQTYHYFRRSTSKTEKYKSIRSVLWKDNPEEVVDAYDTLWLSVENAVSKILDCWNDLSLYFQENNQIERSYLQSQLYTLYSTPYMQIYVLFLGKVLKLVKGLVEVDNDNPFNLFTNLLHLSSRISEMVNDPISYVYDHRSLYCDAILLEDVERRCRIFLKELEWEITRRFPNSIYALKNLYCFSSRGKLFGDQESLEFVCRALQIAPHDFHVLQEQWCRLVTMCERLEGDWPNTVAFWSQIRKCSQHGDTDFGLLCDFVISTMVICHFDPGVENSFKQLNAGDIEKEETLHMQNALLTIRAGLRRMGIPCSHYEVPHDIKDKVSEVLNAEKRKHIRERP